MYKIRDAMFINRQRYDSNQSDGIYWLLTFFVAVPANL